MLHFFHQFNQPITIELPHTLKKIWFGKAFNQDLPENLPDSIEEIVLSNTYKRILPNKLPKSLKQITIRKTKQNLVLGQRYYNLNGFLHREGENLMIKLKCKYW